MAKKLHAADASDIEKIGTATHFTVHLRKGPGEKITKRAKTLAAAIKAADSIGVTASGKKPLIYAITPDRLTIHGPAAMIAQARKECAASGARRKAESERKPRGKAAAALEAAQRGELPAAPNFSAETHKRFRGKLAELVALAEAGDAAGLKAFPINPYSSSPKAMARYRDLAVITIEARGAA